MDSFKGTQLHGNVPKGLLLRERERERERDAVKKRDRERGSNGMQKVQKLFADVQISSKSLGEPEGTQMLFD